MNRPVDLYTKFVESRVARCKKKRHRSREMAESVLSWLLRIRAQRQDPLQPGKKRHEHAVYQCPFCGYWHLTSQTLEENAEQQRRKRASKTPSVQTPSKAHGEPVFLDIPAIPRPKLTEGMLRERKKRDHQEAKENRLFRENGKRWKRGWRE
jgi:hypothetical protein